MKDRLQNYIQNISDASVFSIELKLLEEFALYCYLSIMLNK
jgi:hypothetical protein